MFKKRSLGRLNQQSPCILRNFFMLSHQSSYSMKDFFILPLDQQLPQNLGRTFLEKYKKFLRVFIVCLFFCCCCCCCFFFFFFLLFSYFFFIFFFFFFLWLGYKFAQVASIFTTNIPRVTGRLPNGFSSIQGNVEGNIEALL